MAVEIGSYITASQWKYPFSDLETKDLLARVIYAEDTVTTAGQAAVAQVLRNRYDNPDGYIFGHEDQHTWAKIVDVGCSVTHDSESQARNPDTSSTIWTNALQLATRLINGQSIGSDVGARYYWKAADRWDAQYANTKVNVKTYMNGTRGNFFHNDYNTFILAIDYSHDANIKYEFMKIIQHRLNDLGFNCGSADGKQGKMTERMIMNYQSSKDLTADGIVGDNTWNALLPVISSGTVNDAVRFLRLRLAAHGYSGLGTSTTFDTNLKNKVMDFQRSMNLDDDGIVGRGTWRALG